MQFLTRLWAAIDKYAAHEDPRVAASNWIALVVAWNQPFYPLYLYGIVGERLTPAFLTFLSTPFFAIIPAVSRRHPMLSRSMLPLVGVGNTMLSTKAFGESSGVEIFLIPCALIAAVFFRPSERLVGLSLVAIVLMVFFGLSGRYGIPLGSFSQPEYRAIMTLNAVSAATLIVFIGILVSGVIARGEAAIADKPRSV